MPIDLTTPALLFSTISLLLLAYTNRFLALASVIRKLHEGYQASSNQIYVEQIDNLRRRIYLIREMQTLGVASLLNCTLCMAAIFVGWQLVGTTIFGLSLLLMVGSLAISLIEIRLSVGALDVQLRDMEK